MNYIKNNIFYFWKIGKEVYEKRNIYDDVVSRYSKYLSYYFGTSRLFTRENIRYMERLYLNFPMYYNKMNNINWEQYKLLFNIRDKDERLFYYYLSLFFNSDLDETREFINNNYYVRI